MDIDLIKHLAEEYENGRRDAEAVMAFACLESYQQGFDDGIHQAEQQFAQTQMLLMFTAGNA